jgi:hypothetical protein
MPIGTVLGVFTIIVLVRPSVKTLLETQPNASTQICSSKASNVGSPRRI